VQQFWLARHVKGSHEHVPPDDPVPPRLVHSHASQLLGSLKQSFGQVHGFSPRVPSQFPSPHDGQRSPTATVGHVDPTLSHTVLQSVGHMKVSNAGTQKGSGAVTPSLH
jgi:hypothetical protein